MRLSRKSIFLSGVFVVTLRGFFWPTYKSSNLKGLRRFVVSFKIALIPIFGSLLPAGAKDSGFLPGTEAFTPPPSKPAPNNQGHFGSKTTSSSSGAPKKDPNENGASQNPAMKEDFKATPTSDHHLLSKKKNKQCSLKNEEKKKADKLKTN
jgi:hypothetical protein